MGWRTVVVNSHSKLSYKNNHLIYRSSSSQELIHLSEIDVLICETTDIVITTMLLKRLVDEGVLVIFCDDKRLPKSMLTPYYARHDSSLQLSKQVEWKLDNKVNLWTEIIRQKIVNQSSHLTKNYMEDKASNLLAFAKDLEPYDPTNREGHSARTYFNALFGTKFTRDDVSDINAGLDYGYILLMSIFAREITKAGCLTQFGLKHSNQFNDFNFASDIMEPFRVIVDDIVYKNRDKTFKQIKRNLFDMFSETYFYKKSDMYLTNIISDYTKKVISNLNGETFNIPEFYYEL